MNDDIDDDEEMAHIQKKMASLKKKADELSTKIANRFYSKVSAIDEKSETYTSYAKTLPDETLDLPKGRPAISKDRRARLFQSLAIKVESTTVLREQAQGTNFLLDDIVGNVAMHTELSIMEQLPKEYGATMIFKEFHTILRHMILLRDPKLLHNVTFRLGVLTSELSEKIFREWYKYFNCARLPIFLEMEFLRMDRVFDHYVDVFLRKVLPDTPRTIPPNRRVLFVRPE